MRGVNYTLATERDEKKRDSVGFGFLVVRRAGNEPPPQLALRTTRLPFLEAVLLAPVEQVRLGASQVDNLRTPVSLPRDPKAKPKTPSVGTGIQHAALRRLMPPRNAAGPNSEPRKAGRCRAR